MRGRLSELVDPVERERVAVARNGRAVAVLLSPEDMAELEETLAVPGPSRTTTLVADIGEVARRAPTAPTGHA